MADRPLDDAVVVEIVNVLCYPSVDAGGSVSVTLARARAMFERAVSAGWLPAKQHLMKIFFKVAGDVRWWCFEMQSKQLSLAASADVLAAIAWNSEIMGAPGPHESGQG